MPALDELKARFRLTDEQRENIQNAINLFFSGHAKPSNTPTVIILGGQPGCGKSELGNKALALLKNNAVICNADEFRDLHPESDYIKQHHEKEYPELTVDYSQPWNNGLVDYCKAKRLNYILETTFSSGDFMNETIKKMKGSGYRVIIMILAVNKDLSLLGTMLRYEESKRTTGFGRLVEPEVHYKKYNEIPATLEKVQQEKFYDEIRIYGRKRNTNSRVNLRLISKNSQSPLGDYLKERDKVWSTEANHYFIADRLQILEMMIRRKAPDVELANVINLFPPLTSNL